MNFRNLSAWSIRNPVVPIVLFIGLALAGVVAFMGMKVQNQPDIEFPLVIVTISQPGAAPTEIENQITQRVESGIRSIAGVDSISSTAQEGSNQTLVFFKIGTDINAAVNQVKNAVDQIRGDLPDGILEPQVIKAETSSQPIAYFVATADDMTIEQLSWFIDDSVAKRLLSVPGMAEVHRGGGVDREIQVILDPSRMQSLGVTAVQVNAALRALNLNAAGGKSEIAGSRQSVRVLGNAKTAYELSQTEVGFANGRTVRVGDVADVKDSYSELVSLAKVNGKGAVTFSIARARGESDVSVYEATLKELDALSKEQGGKVHFANVFNSVEFTKDLYRSSLSAMVEGAILAVIVVFFFLRDWRSTFVSALAIPLSSIPTFFVLKWMGITLNQMSMLALSLVAGVLVDDAIVEIENIVRHLHMGKTPLQAALDASDEIGLAVVATTFTLVSVFLPTAFMSGIPGKFFKQFGWTAALAVMASLVVARLLTPMMAAYFLKPIAEEIPQSALMTRYLHWMRWCLTHRVKTSLMAVAFFIGSLMLIPLLPSGFIPTADRALTQVTIELQPGSRLAQTARVAEQARLLIESIPEVKQVFTSVGQGASGDMFSAGGESNVRKANLTVMLVHRSERKLTQSQVEAVLRRKMEALPGVRVTVGTGDAGEKLQLTLSGEDSQILAGAVRNVERDLRTIPGLGNISSDASLVRPEITIRPDFARMADLGVTAEAVGDVVRIATAGDYSAQLAKLNLPQRQVPIRVQMHESAREDMNVLLNLPVPGKRGNVMLGNVASISMSSGSAQINRLDRSRNVTINIELNGQQLGDVFAKVNKLPSLNALPPGVIRAESGDAKRMKELFGSFGLAMLTGVLCVYIVLVLLFREFLQPLTILAALPLSIGGAFVALLATHSSFSMPSLIGLLMLMGIVTKNSILLVEYAITARRVHGMNRFDALVDACSKRARPIVMTTIAMGAGMLPIAMGLGADPSFRMPMATTVIGGLITSTLLSLFVVPVVFTYVDDLVQKIVKLGERLPG
jgi:multidrug efflux pump subunit AcrB